MKITKKILSMILTVVMMLGLLPATAFATGAEDVVYLSISFDSTYIDDKNGNPIAYVPVSLDAVAAIDLVEYGLDNMLYDADGDGEYETTALQLLIYAHEELYGGDWGEVNFDALPGSSYFKGGIFGFTENLVYFHNGDFPVDESQQSDYMTVGATSDRIVLEAGDFLDVASFGCYNFLWDQAGGFHLFADANDNYTHDYAANAGEALDIKLKHSFCDLMYGVAWVKDAEYFEVYYGATFGIAEGSVTTDESGNAQITFPNAGTYYVWCEGGIGIDDGFTHTTCDHFLETGEPCIVSSPAFAKVTVAALGHSYVYTNNGEDHSVSCSNDCSYTATEAHSFVEGTCICGAVEITEPILDANLTYGAQLYLENDLTMAFRVKADKLSKYDISTAYLVVEREVYETGAKEATVVTSTISEYEVKEGRLVFSYPGIAAAQMNDAITATLYIKDAKGQEYVSPVLSTSVATYLDGLLTNSASDTKLVTLIMDMVNYGAAAQVFFDRHADAPVSEAFDSFKTYADFASADFASVLEDLSATENADGKAGKLNIGLDLGTRIGIQYKVTVPAGIAAEDVTLVVTDANGNTLETLTLTGEGVTTDAKGRYVVNFYGSTSKDMRRVVYATAYANGEAITGTYAYSISTYAWGIQANASAMTPELVAVTRAMMLYGDSATEYFK